MSPLAISSLNFFESAKAVSQTGTGRYACGDSPTTIFPFVKDLTAAPNFCAALTPSR
jgi:hypothetical protein